MNLTTQQAVTTFIDQLQYYIGQQGYEVAIKNKHHDTPEFALLSELVYILDYFYENTFPGKTDEEILALLDFFETRYNLNTIPYIFYPKRITEVLKGIGVSQGSSSNVSEAPSDNRLYGRINKSWQEIPNALLSINQTFVNNSNEAYSWGDHSLVGYALASSLHNPVTLGTSNGLSLSGQQLSLSLATESTSGAMSAIDKIKLNGLSNHDQVTLGTSNGLSLSGQELSLSLATTSSSGAMSATDKVKLNNLENYVHPIGFTNQPLTPLNGANVISQITISNEGHVTGVQTRELTLSNLGIVKGSLTKTDDTNVTLSIGGNPTDSLFESVSLTLGWTGLLSVDRGGTGVNSFTAGQLLLGNGTNPISTISRNGIDTRTSFPPQSHTLTFHSDVSITSPSNGQVLAYQGGIWINTTLAGAGITLTETDPVFVAWRDTVRTANTFYSAPNGTNAIASFRNIVRQDLPDIYVRFDTNSQGLTTTQKNNVLTNIGAQSLLSLSDIVGDSIVSVTNGVGKAIGTVNIDITHAVSGWVDKTSLTGANVISNLTVNSTGHISNWTTRALTLADLGFVAFDPSTIESTLDDHETRITALELAFPLLTGDKNYVHTQNTAAAIWNITHNMGKKPSVTIIDSAGSMVFAKLVYVDSNVIQINFNGQLTSGEAILN